MFDFRIQYGQGNRLGTQAHLESESGLEYFIDIDPTYLVAGCLIYAHTAFEGQMLSNTLTIYKGGQIKSYSINC